MPDTFTPNLNLAKPEVGSSRDAWGTKWNNNADVIDAAVKAAMNAIAAFNPIPPGAMAYFARPDVPAGWLRCNGARLSRTAYANLYAAIGGYYGSYDQYTFDLPDLRGLFLRVLDENRGVDPGRALGTAVQGSQNLAHGHDLTGGGAVVALYGGGASLGGTNGASLGLYAQYIAQSGGAEARPINLAFPVCIKY